jgi:hypothetical protein
MNFYANLDQSKNYLEFFNYLEDMIIYFKINYDPKI